MNKIDAYVAACQSAATVNNALRRFSDAFYACIVPFLDALARAKYFRSHLRGANG